MALLGWSPWPRTGVGNWAATSKFSCPCSASVFLLVRALIKAVSKELHLSPELDILRPLAGHAPMHRALDPSYCRHGFGAVRQHRS